MYMPSENSLLDYHKIKLTIFQAKKVNIANSLEAPLIFLPSYPPK